MTSKTDPGHRRLTDRQLTRYQWLTASECRRRLELEGVVLTIRQVQNKYTGKKAPMRSQLRVRDDDTRHPVFWWPLLFEIALEDRKRAGGRVVNDPSAGAESSADLSGMGTLDLKELKLRSEARIKAADAEKREAENAARRRETIQVGELLPLMRSDAEWIKTRIEELPGELSGALADCTEAAAEAMLEEWSVDFLEAYAARIERRIKAVKE